MPGSPENILWGKWCFRWLTKCWKNLVNICVKFAGQERGSQEGTRPLTVESDERTESPSRRLECVLCTIRMCVADHTNGATVQLY